MGSFFAPLARAADALQRRRGGFAKKTRYHGLAKRILEKLCVFACISLIFQKSCFSHLYRPYRICFLNRRVLLLCVLCFGEKERTPEPSAERGLPAALFLFAMNRHSGARFFSRSLGEPSVHRGFCLSVRRELRITPQSLFAPRRKRARGGPILATRRETVRISALPTHFTTPTIPSDALFVPHLKRTTDHDRSVCQPIHSSRRQS